MRSKHEEVALDPAYWVERINNDVYDALVTLGISKGRLSQILNSGETNFTIEKLCTIALKINKTPNLEFKDKDVFIEETNSRYQQIASTKIG